MPDSTAESIKVLRDALLPALSSRPSTIDAKQKVITTLRALRVRHDRCIEVVAASAVIDFFSGNPGGGTKVLTHVFSHINEYYSARCFGVLSVPRIRKLVEQSASIAPIDYVRFLFPLYSLRERFSGDGYLYAWIKEEWKKRSSLKQYGELFLLRNMTWSALLKPSASEFAQVLGGWVRSMDSDIIKILRKRLDLRATVHNVSPSSIVICCGVLKTSYRFVHARLVFDYARNLARRYPHLTIHIVATNEIPFSWAGYSHWMKAAENNYISELREMANQIVGDELGNRVRYKYLPLVNGDHQDLLLALNVVLDIDPDVLMFYGSKFHNESWFVRKILFPYYPVAYFFTQMINKVDRDNDIYLARNAEPLRGTYDKDHVRVAPPAMDLEIVVPQSLPAKSSAAKPVVERDAAQVTIVTLLAGTRLETILASYDPLLRRRMMDLLNVPNVRWIWVGAARPNAVLKVDPLFREYSASGKLEVRGFDPHVGELLSQCHLMLHLPGFTGGAGGMSLALRIGMPVLCFRNTDAAVYMLPECAFDPADVEGFFAVADRLVRNPTQLRELGARTYEHYVHFDVGDLAKLTYDGLCDAVQFYNDRTQSSADRLSSPKIEV